MVIEATLQSHPAALITSPEYSMKKLLGLGLEKIFTITKVFRNEESLGGNHNPEFTMLEWYTQGADYQACMDETEEMIKQIDTQFSSHLTKTPWKRVRVRDLFLERVGIDLDCVTTDDLKQACTDHAIHFVDADTESDLFYRLFLSLVEPNLGNDPVFVYD